MLENNNYYKPSGDISVMTQLANGGGAVIQLLSIILCFSGLIVMSLIGFEMMEPKMIYLGLGLIFGGIGFPFFFKIGKLPLQVNSVVINFFSVFFVALTLLDHMVEPLLTVGVILFIMSLICVFLVKSLPILTYVARVLVGGLFIVSGMIKANDPEGFSYKLHDYFSANALDLEFLNDAAIYLAIIIAVGEIVLGFAVLVGGKIKLTSWTLLLMILFFSWLTFYTSECLDTKDDYDNVIGIINAGDSALEHDKPAKVKEAIVKYEFGAGLLEDLGSSYQDSLKIGFQGRLDLAKRMSEAIGALGINDGSDVYKVKAAEILAANKEEISKHLSAHEVPSYWRQCVDDCGCFGDALKGSVGRSLLPWESFGKDAVLLYFVLLIFAQQNRIKLNTRKEDLWLIGTALIFIGFLCWVFDNWYFSLLFSILVFGAYAFLKRIQLRRMGNEWPFAIFVTIAASSVAIYTYTYLPIKDYRAYAVGSNLVEKMNDGEAPVIEQTYRMINRETKEEKYFTQDEFMANWKVIDSIYIHLMQEAKFVKLEIPRSISDFGPFTTYGSLPGWLKKNDKLTASLFDPSINPIYQVLYMPEYDAYDSLYAEDYKRDILEYPDSVYQDKGTYQKQPVDNTTVMLTDFILQSDAVILIVSRLLDDAYMGRQEDLNAMALEAQEAGIPVFCLTSSTEELKAEFKANNDITYPFANADDTELKILVRSNPGILLIQKSVVKGKWSSRSVPSFETIQNLLED